MPHITSLLLDRDGTVIKDKHYLHKPRGVALLPGVGEALGALASQGMRFFLVSNQSGVGRGMFPEEAVAACNARLAELLARYGVVLTDSVYCPHAPEENCACRKPGTGMWETLSARHSLDPACCLMAGDKVEDIRFGSAAGVALRILVLTGKGQDTAERCGLELPGKRWYALTGEPESVSHPHLVLPSLALLPQGLDLYHIYRDSGEPVCVA